MATPSDHFTIILDFGTTFSGYCFATSSGNQVREIPISWPGAPFAYPKNRTCVLYEDKKPLLWGWEAYNYWTKAKKRDNLFLAEKFKMSLYEPIKFPQAPWLQPYRAIVDFLEKLAGAAKTSLQDRFRHTYNESKIKWFLTVPAIWDEGAKDKMKQAAYEARLIESPQSDRLQIVLEPEGAAIATTTEEAGGSVKLQHGDTFVVVDAGGGTVDLSSFRAEGEPGYQRFREVVPGMGGACGCSYVDAEFLNFFRTAVGKDLWSRAETTKPEVVIRIMREWESRKREFTGQNETDGIEIPPWMLKQMSTDVRQKFSDDQIELPLATMKKIFDPIIEKIILLTRTQLRKSGAVDFIFGAGGFCESPYLQKRLQQEFGSAVRKGVMFPLEAPSAVMRGALWFGLHPVIIQERVARYTYGVGTSGLWDATLDSSCERARREGKDYCLHRFQKMVTIGDHIPVHRAQETVLYPLEPGQTAVRLEIYKSTEKNPIHSNESTMRRVGEYTLPLTRNGTEDMTKRGVLVRMLFGKASIECSARDQSNGDQVIARFDREE